MFGLNGQLMEPAQLLVVLPGLERLLGLGILIHKITCISKDQN